MKGFRELDVFVNFYKHQALLLHTWLNTCGLVHRILLIVFGNRLVLFISQGDCHLMLKFDQKAALAVGITGCISLATAFVIAALAHVQIRATLTASPRAKLVVEINPVNSFERLPVIRDGGGY